MLPAHSSSLFHARHWARRLTLQALYQWQMTRQNLTEIELQFTDNENYHKIDTQYFHELLHGIPACRDELDARLNTCLDRPIEEVDPVERAMLRIACYELFYRHDVPYKVVINEAINLTKKFGAEHSHKFVNGVLDKMAKILRLDKVEKPSEA